MCACVGRGGGDGRCQVTRSCSGQLNPVFKPQEIYTNIHYGSDKNTCVCYTGYIEASSVLHSPAIKPPGGHMEGIKPTKVNDDADRRDGWQSSHGVTPTYHGELGYGHSEGGLRGR